MKYCTECGIKLKSVIVLMKDMNHIYPSFKDTVKKCLNKECIKYDNKTIEWW